MGSAISIKKLNSLPTTLEANTLYFIRNIQDQSLQIVFSDAVAQEAYSCISNKDDADTLNGMSSSSEDIPDTIMSRDGSGNTEVASIYATNWYNSLGNTGWINVTHGGGIYMTDSQWIRTYGGKVLYVNNDIYSTGDVKANYSDIRLKTKVDDLKDALGIISKIDGFKYIPNELARECGYKSDRVEIGFSAQQLQSVLPELVDLAPFDMHVDKAKGVISKSGNHYLTVNYHRYIPVLSMGIKQLYDKHKKLVTKVNKLEKRIKELEDLVASLIAERGK